MTRAAPGAETITRFVRRIAQQPWLLVATGTTVALALVAIRALADGVQLIDERALIELRARDVFTGHHPLVGTKSTAGGFNHPGPLEFDLLSVPVRLLGGPVGVTLAVIAVNIAMIWLAGVAARRAGGPDLALTVVAAATVLCWTMGSDVLIDPWPANFPVLPFFALLVLTAAVIAGDHRSLPMVIVVASFCAQTHLSYILVAPALVITAAAPVVAKAWRRPSRASRRLIVRSAGVALVLWVQPLWQQLFGPGPGNMSSVISEAWGADRAGWRLAARLLASIVVAPPAWWRPSFDLDQLLVVRAADGNVAATSEVLPLLPAVAVLAVLAVLSAWCLRTGMRRGLPGVTPTLLVVAMASAVALITLTTLSLDPFGVATHKFRFLWPLGAFVAGVFAASALHAARALVPPPNRAAARWAAPARWLAPSIVILAVVLAGFTVPTHTHSEGAFTRRDVWPVAAELRSQLATVDDLSTVLIETEQFLFIDYFTWAVMAELDRQGIEFVVDTDIAVHQVGARRRDDGSADARLYLVVGGWATATFDGSRLIAHAVGVHEWLEVGVFIEEATHRRVSVVADSSPSGLPPPPGTVPVS